MLNYLDLVDSQWMWAVLVPVLALLAIDGIIRLIQHLVLDVPASDAESWTTRAYQIQRFRNSRLAHLLQSAGLSLSRYESNLTVRQLRSQLDVCERCSVENKLETQGCVAGGSDLGWVRCPNRASIQAMLGHGR